MLISRKMNRISYTLRNSGDLYKLEKSYKTSKIIKFMNQKNTATSHKFDNLIREIAVLSHHQVWNFFFFAYTFFPSIEWLWRDVKSKMLNWFFRKMKNVQWSQNWEISDLLWKWIENWVAL